MTIRLQSAIIVVALGLASCGKDDSVPETITPPNASRVEIEAPVGAGKSKLLPRSGSGGEMLFEAMSAARSGLDFEHVWAPRDELESELVTTSFAGGGVALGDIDNDGLPDVFLTRPHSGARLYRNLGDFKFEDITGDVGLDKHLDDLWSISATMVDVQGDGFLDIYVCAYASANKLFLNNGDGTFTESAKEFGLDFSGASLMMSFADYDRDGDLDAHLLTNRLTGAPRPEKIDFKLLPSGAVITPEEHRDELGALLKPDGTLEQYDAGQRNRLYRNDGKGRFAEVAESAGMGRALAGPVGDVVGLRLRRLDRSLCRQRFFRSGQSLPQQR